MKETIGTICLVLLIGLTTGYFVIRPLIAIGDIPSEIRKLRESVDKLSKIIRNKYEQEYEQTRSRSTREGNEK